METLEQMRRNRSRFRLPEPLDGDTHFTWGPVVKVHKIPELNIIVIQYHDQIYEKGSPTGRYEETECKFHLHSTSSSFDSLEDAIIFGIGKYNKVCEDFARAACHLLKKPTPA